MADDFRDAMMTAMDTPADEAAIPDDAPDVDDELDGEPSPADDEDEGDNGSDPDEGDAPTAEETETWKQELAELRKSNPAAARLVDMQVREMQRGLTPKLQRLPEAERELAELRARAGNLRPETAQWAATLDNLASVSPAQAAQLLMAEAERLQGLNAPAVQEDDWSDTEFVTEQEERLARELTALKQQVAPLMQWQQQQQQVALRAEIDGHFSKLEAQHGPIPEADRIAVLQQIAGHGAGVQAIPIYWMGMHPDRVGRKATEAAVKQTLAKARLPAAPSNISSRAADAPAEKPASYREALERELGIA
jgi:hypothetical protein